MKLSLSDESQSNSISAYAEGCFTVRGQVFTGSHIFWPDLPPKPWSATSIENLSAEDFEQIASEKVEAIIIGTGQKLVFPDDSILETIYRQSIGVEIMDTAAACRTFNILVSEDRNILAALIPV